MPLFLEVPVKSLAPEYQGPALQYAQSAFDLAKLRNASISPSLRDKLKNHCSALKLNSQYIEELNISDYVAKVNGICIANEHHATEEQNQLWIFAATHAILLIEFDDYFDTPCNTPDNVSRLSMEMRSVLRALSRHLQGGLDDWPTGVPCKEAYLWLLKESECLRKGAAELIHYMYIDYCFGVEMEITEWSPDMHRCDTSAWNLDRCNEVRKRSIGVVSAAIAGPLYVANNWMKKEHITNNIDQVYNASIIVALANDILGLKRDGQERECMAIGLKTAKIASASEIIQHHNEKVKCLNKCILDLDGDTRHFMEEIEVTTVGLFLWHCNAKRYDE